MHISLVTQHGAAVGRNLSAKVASSSGAIMTSYMFLEAVFVLVPGSTDVALNLWFGNTGVLQLMALESGSTAYDLGAYVAHSSIVAMRHLDVRTEKGLVGESVQNKYYIFKTT